MHKCITSARIRVGLVSWSGVFPNYYSDIPSLLTLQGSEFLILASDGLWDKLKNNEVVSRVRRWLSEDGLSVTEAAEKLVDMAITKYGADDNTRYA